MFFLILFLFWWREGSDRLVFVVCDQIVFCSIVTFFFPPAAAAAAAAILLYQSQCALLCFCLLSIRKCGFIINYILYNKYNNDGCY